MKREKPGRKKSNPESGYVLLLFFAMAAIVAIGLYTQLPIVAFEAQRDKEQLLIDRGQQYSRAIQLFVHKFNRFPISMDELENTNNIRFLRRRYTDPMTGKDNWRIIHAGPGGVLLDSIATTKKADAETQQTFITQINMVNPTTSDGEGVNLAMRHRPSDQPGAAGDPNNAGGGGSGSDPSQTPTNSGIPGYNGPVMVLPDGRIVPASTAFPSQTGSSPMPGLPGASGVNGSLGSGGAPFPGGVLPGGLLPGGVLPGAASTQQNTPPLPGQAGTLPSSAANMINQILTSPRPGGMNGLFGGQPVNAQGNLAAGQAGAAAGGFGTPVATVAQAPQQQVIGAGLAGVASKREQEAIKTYNQKTWYNEWEFVYDVTKDPSKRGAVGASGSQQPPAAGQGAPGQSTPGQSMSGQPTGGQPPIPAAPPPATSQ
jgi:hypothetical protein